MEFEITKSNLESLEKLFRTQFLDLSKIVELFNPKAAADFKSMNAAFMREHLKSHDHDHVHDGSGCSHEETKKYFIPEDKMSAVDRTTNQLLFKRKDFYTLEQGKNMKLTLEQINEAFSHFKKQAKSRGMEFDATEDKKLMTKCLFETVNRVIHQEVRKELIRIEQTYSKSPGLLANPQGLKETILQQAAKDGVQLNMQELHQRHMEMINQLEATTLTQFDKECFAQQRTFLKEKKLLDYLTKAFEKLELMEVEGPQYFKLHKSPLPVADRVRTDKIFAFQLNQIQNNKDFESIYQVMKQLSVLPFELNAKYQNDMQLQVCEAFEVSYLDAGEHQFIKLKQDNSSMAPEHKDHDTGVKLTALYIINKDTKADREYGQVTLNLIPTGPGAPAKMSFDLRHNSLVLLKSRKVQYEIRAKSQKVFVVAMKVSGPRADKF